ncbi:MAG TPA: hypothetical protein VGB96_13330 [Archangium sp.]
MRTLSMLLLVLSTGCAPKHVMLWTGESGTGSLYECSETSKQETCAPSRNETLVNETLSGTLYLDLPKQCAGRVHQILLHDVRSGRPRVFVKCAPPENPPSSTP